MTNVTEKPKKVKVWMDIIITPAPKGELVETCIMSESGAERNVQNLKFIDGRWRFENGIAVYYNPTHWRRKS